jgi:hypothetical protein
LPGKKITDHQVQKYKHHHLKLSQVAAAAKAGISERSARRIEHSDALPSQREERSWRTRADPLAAVWDSEIVPLLEADAALNAVTLLEELQRRYPGDYGTAILRTPECVNDFATPGVMNLLCRAAEIRGSGSPSVAG